MDVSNFIAPIGLILMCAVLFGPELYHRFASKKLKEYRLTEVKDNSIWANGSITYKVQQNTTRQGWITLYSSGDRRVMEQAFMIVLGEIPEFEEKVLLQHPSTEERKVEKW